MSKFQTVLSALFNVVEMVGPAVFKSAHGLQVLSDIEVGLQIGSVVVGEVSAAPATTEASR